MVVRKAWTRKAAEYRLAALGFEVDWSVTGRADGSWSGTIDAIGRGQIDGDCRGESVDGDNAQDWYANAVRAAEYYAAHGPNAECTDPECDFHAGHPIQEKAS